MPLVDPRSQCLLVCLGTDGGCLLVIASMFAVMTRVLHVPAGRDQIPPLHTDPREEKKDLPPEDICPHFGLSHL
jgi:hypothetical protein